jgi:hypothetical protein
VADNIDFQDILSISLLHSALCYPSISFLDYLTLRSFSYQASLAACLILCQITMEYLKKKAQRSREAIVTDTTLQRTVRYGSKAVRAAPSVAGQYLLQKAPIIQWLPKYNPRWLLNDTLAGITVGVLLIPQSLAYAKIATIPGQYGLMSSWLPNFLYLIMGTSKGKSKPRVSSNKLTIFQIYLPALPRSWDS